ncbi:hypothetical protein KBD08_04640 [Candidatus Babeliales bacterium]|nr:hypothetical protein [Candidatus Babeliales bacterium]
MFFYLLFGLFISLSLQARQHNEFDFHPITEQYQPTNHLENAAHANEFNEFAGNLIASLVVCGAFLSITHILSKKPCENQEKTTKPHQNENYQVFVDLIEKINFEKFQIRCSAMLLAEKQEKLNTIISQKKGHADETSMLKFSIQNLQYEVDSRKQNLSVMIKQAKILECLI